MSLVFCSILEVSVVLLKKPQVHLAPELTDYVRTVSDSVSIPEEEVPQSRQRQGEVTFVGWKSSCSVRSAIAAATVHNPKFCNARAARTVLRPVRLFDRIATPLLQGHTSTPRLR